MKVWKCLFILVICLNIGSFFLNCYLFYQHPNWITGLIMPLNLQCAVSMSKLVITEM